MSSGWARRGWGPQGGDTMWEAGVPREVTRCGSLAHTAPSPITVDLERAPHVTVHPRSKLEPPQVP